MDYFADICTIPQENISLTFLFHMKRLQMLALLGFSVVLFAACTQTPATEEGAVDAGVTDTGAAATEEVAE